MIGFIMFGIAVAGLIYASWTDIKTREVPNRVSFGLIGLLLLLRLIYSSQTGNFSFFWIPLVVGIGFLLMGLAFFYAQQWGGADIKLLIVLGVGFSVLPSEFSPVFLARWPFFLTILINFFAISVIYSVMYSIDMAFQNPKVFEDFRASLNRMEVIILFLLSTIAAAAGFYLNVLWVALVGPVLWALIKFLKSVEKNCMYKKVPVNRLVEFDVPEKDIEVDGETVVSSGDPNGITPEQIEKVKKLAEAEKIPKSVKIKWGVPLVPVFPITLIVSLFVGDLFFMFLKLLPGSSL